MVVYMAVCIHTLICLTYISVFVYIKLNKELKVRYHIRYIENDIDTKHVFIINVFVGSMTNVRCTHTHTHTRTHTYVYNHIYALTHRRTKTPEIRD